MKKYIIIPARYESSRLPGKPLADIGGKPLIQHVIESMSPIDGVDIVVATDDNRIKAVAEKFPVTVCMTEVDHQSGTERIAEVIDQLGINDDDIIVNVQGDEPFISVVLIQQLIINLENNDVPMATLCEPFETADAVLNPNNVKVVMDKNNCAIYFSRAPIPWYRDGFTEKSITLPSELDHYRHVGLYAYRAGFVKKYITWTPSPLEKIEALEQLRVLYYGEKIHVDIAKAHPGIGVDTQEDLEMARERYKAMSSKHYL